MNYVTTMIMCAVVTMVTGLVVLVPGLALSVRSFLFTVQGFECFFFGLISISTFAVTILVLNLYHGR